MPPTAPNGLKSPAPAAAKPVVPSWLNSTTKVAAPIFASPPHALPPSKKKPRLHIPVLQPSLEPDPSKEPRAKIRRIVEKQPGFSSGPSNEQADRNEIALNCCQRARKLITDRNYAEGLKVIRAGYHLTKEAEQPHQYIEYNLLAALQNKFKKDWAYIEQQMKTAGTTELDRHLMRGIFCIVRLEFQAAYDALNCIPNGTRDYDFARILIEINKNKYVNLKGNHLKPPVVQPSNAPRPAKAHAVTDRTLKLEFDPAIWLTAEGAQLIRSHKYDEGCKNLLTAFKTVKEWTAAERNHYFEHTLFSYLLESFSKDKEDDQSLRCKFLHEKTHELPLMAMLYGIYYYVGSPDYYDDAIRHLGFSLEKEGDHQELVQDLMRFMQNKKPVSSSIGSQQIPEKQAHRG